MRRNLAVFVALTTAVILIASLTVYFSLLNKSKLVFARDPSNPLLLGRTEPDVIKVGATSYMYYRTDHSIGVATSSDVLTWIDNNETIINPCASGWDSNETIAPSAFLDDGHTTCSMRASTTRPATEQ